MSNNFKKDKEGYFLRYDCPLCGESISVSAITCEEDPNYSEFNCKTHGLIQVYQDGKVITLLDKLKGNCMTYISLLNIGDASINRVVVHEEIAQALGLNHHDKNLQEITDNMDEKIGLPLDGCADPVKYGIKLFNLLNKEFLQ